MHHKCRPQQGCTTSHAQIARLLSIYASQMSTSTGIIHFGSPDCEASVNLCIINVDLNRDYTLRMSRLRSFCQFMHHKRRPPRLQKFSFLTRSRNGQFIMIPFTTTFIFGPEPGQILFWPRHLVLFAHLSSTSTGIIHFGCPDCEASVNLCITNVDLNKDAPLRMPRLRGFCSSMTWDTWAGGTHSRPTNRSNTVIPPTANTSTLRLLLARR